MESRKTADAIEYISNYSTLILILFLLVYNILWDYIEIMRFLSFNAYVYDAGVFMANSYQFIHLNLYNIPVQAKVSQIIQRPFGFLLSPISLLPGYYNYEFYFILQSLFISLPSFFIYKILKVTGHSNLLSLTIGSLYLIYFPLSGPNFFDLHSANAFIPFFFGGIYYYYKGNFKNALILLLISSLVRYPLAIFPLLFGLSNLFFILLQRSKARDKELSFSLVLFIISTVILSISYIVNAGSTNYTASDFHIYNYSFMTILRGITLNADSKIMTLILYFLPLSFIPLFSKRFLILYFPFIIYLFISNFSTLLIPQAFLYQYPLLIAPFLYLGLVDVLVNKKRNVNKNVRGEIVRNHAMKSHYEVTAIVISVLILTSATAVVFEPYSPANSLAKEQFFSGVPFDFGSTINVTKADQIFAKALPYLIPADNPYVLVENNIPQVFPRMLPYFNTPLVGDGNVIGNVTYSSVQNNSYPIWANHKWVYTKIDFVIADVLNSVGFYVGYSGVPGGLPDSINSFVNIMLESGYYGILAEIGGFLVLERNYTSEPKLFYPLNINLLNSQEYPFKNPAMVDSRAVNLRFIQVNGSLDLTMNYFTLVPGTYRINIYGSNIYSKNVLKNASISVEVSGDFGYEKFLPLSIINLSYSKFYGTFEFIIPNESYIGFCSVVLLFYGIYGIINVNRFYISQMAA